MTSPSTTLESLQRRMRAMHSLWYDAVDTMDLSHVNHVERAEVLPIAFSLFHQAQIEDRDYQRAVFASTFSARALVGLYGMTS